MTDRELLEELMFHITCTHLDMGGKHRYSLSMKAYEVIEKIKLKLWEDKKNGA